MRAKHHRWKLAFAVPAALAVILAALPAAPGTVAPAKSLAMPFRPGETLNYRVAWAAFSSAATVQLTVPEQRNLFGYATWHFRAQAHTLSPVRSLLAIDDQFDSYTDQATLESRQYETHLNELGKTQDDVFHFAPAGQAPRAPGPVVVVLAGTRDPLGTLYALRHVDWNRTPEFRGPVYDGRDIYQLTAQRDAATENVQVAAGAFSSTRVSVALFQNEKEVSAIHFTVWFANDATRTPVLMQAQLPFGKLRAELVSASH
ncbi:MAG: DUF3108 domain-containing protein [Candidatus Acidiferrales bacterium]|jgi:hypothetical protein